MHLIARRTFLQTAARTTGLAMTSQLSLFGSTRWLKISAALPAANLPDRLSPEWYRRKVAQVQGEMAKRKLDALVLLRAVNVIYTTGYFHLSTERPLAALIPKTGDPVLFIPELESDQVKLWWVKEYESYFDYPGPVARVRWIFERVASRGFGQGRIGIEECAPSRMKQIKLGAPGAEIVVADDLVERMRYVKDQDEVNLMRRGMYFNDFAIQAGREYVQAHGSVSENEILKAAADALADKMAAELKDVVGIGIDPPFGGLVPFGKRSAFPHAIPSKERLKKGDALILSYTTQLGGYAVECERSFCVGQPSDYAKRLFDAMLAAHDTGVENLRDGAVAEDVDKKSLDQIRKVGFEKFLRHRTGHGIGLEGHEAPWIAEGDKTVLEPGMTFSCEPGVYDPDWGGFRHSDTVVVRKDKGEVLNSYPTRLEEMIIEV
ncbi:MAG: aminopeptidase P family protein [Acidobacteria bacterium]|nr:aminopeptidase P family protein [Acidobacteriota bacterium]MBV9625760.1 aminopeptidase P family protein [Acidobacteriota bacterium]